MCGILPGDSNCSFTLCSPSFHRSLGTALSIGLFLYSPPGAPIVLETQLPSPVHPKGLAGNAQMFQGCMDCP